MNIDIKTLSGETRFSTPINSGAKGYYSLMEHDYIVLPFTVSSPIDFSMGDYVDLRGVFDDALGGKLAKIYKYISLQNPTTEPGSYSYELRLDAYYYEWNNKIFKYTPEKPGQEASWSLTAPLDVQLGVFLRNLKANGYTYNGVDYEFSIDSTVENKALLMTYDNISLLDALFSMADEDKWNCDCWVTENVIHFGRCEYGDAVKIELGVEAAEMTRSESKGTYATRIYAFGSTRNLPSNYREIEESTVVNGVVQQRLMLPEGTPYIDAWEDMTDAEAVENIVVFDDVYPRRIGTLSDVTTVEYTDEVEQEDGSTVEEPWEAYRFKDTGITFSEEYILPGNELTIVFQSGKLNGMEFAVIFNPDDKSPEEQLWEIVRNEDYGRPLPDETLKPEDGDEYILSGFDTQFVSVQMLPDAEEELKERAEAYVARTAIDDGTYPTTLYSDWVMADQIARTFDVGQRIKLVNPGYFPAEGRTSRVIGWEMNLDIPYDSPVYTIGESAQYSRIGNLEEQVDSLTYKGQVYVGSGGSGVYVVRVNDSTPASDTNVFSSLRSLNTLLRKDKEDVTAFVITFLKGLRINGDYISDVIMSPEELEESDDVIMSVLKAVSTFLRKDKEDATNYLLKLIGGAEFGNYESGESGGKVDANGAAEFLSALIRGMVTATGIETPNFSTGALGTGFTLKIDENGDSYIEVDRMLVRKLATFVQLLIQKIKAVGGQIILSPATMTCSSVEEYDDYYRCYFENTDGEKTIAQEFEVGDQARCQTFNIKEGLNENVSNTYYWRLVVGTGDNYIDLSKTDCDTGSTVPAADDEIVQLGNRTDPTRQAAIILAAYGNDAPYFKMYRGINSYSMDGKEFISFSRSEVMIIADTLKFSTGESIKDYIDSTMGEAIIGVDVEYALSDSPTVAPTSGWSTTAPTWESGKYMWQRTATTTASGTSYSDPTCIQGAKGEDGSTVGISAIEEQYYLSTSNTTQTGGTWQTTCPTWESGKYIWTRSKITWDDGDVTYTTPVLASYINDMNESLQGFKEEVQASFEATNESITAAVESAKTYTDETGEHILSETTSMIQVAKDEISLSVDTKIDNLAIGGRNLFRYSGLESDVSVDDMSAGRGNHSRSIDTSNKYLNHNSLKVVATGAGNNTGSNDTVLWTWLRDGTSNLQKACVFSFYAKAGTAGTQLRFRFGGTTGVQDGSATLTTSWTRYEIEATPRATWTDICFWLSQADTVYIALFKVEYGNKATDWTPAPEDTGVAITELSASITVLEDSITSLVSKKDFDELGNLVATHTSQISQLSDRITLAVTSDELEEAKDEVLASAASDAASKYVTQTTYNNKMSSIDVQLSSITSRVSSTETKVTTIDGELQSITERVSAAELKITDSAINAVVYEQTKQIADAAVDDLSVGSRNYALSTSTEYKQVSHTWLYNYLSANAVVGETYTYSFKYIKIEEGSSNAIQFVARLDGESVSGFSDMSNNCIVYLNDSEGYVITTFTCTAEFDEFGFFSNQNTSYAEVKFEKGNKATDWTPAFEDYPTTTEIKSSFTMTTDGISLLGQEISLTGKVTFSMLGSDAQSKVNTAQSTADAAQSTANSAQSTANTANTTAQNAQNTANSVSSSLDSLKTSLGDMAYEDAVSVAMLDDTIIQGGYIKTSLIDVDNLYVKHLEGADGVFTGSLQAATGSFSGEVTATSGKIGGWTIDSNSLKSDDLQYPSSLDEGDGIGSVLKTDAFMINCGEGSNGILPGSTGSKMAAYIGATGTNAYLGGLYISANNTSQYASLSQVIALEISATNAYSDPAYKPLALKVTRGTVDIPGILIAGRFNAASFVSEWRFGINRAPYSVARSQTGYYQITHNLGHTDYTVIASPFWANTSGNQEIDVADIAANTFSIVTRRGDTWVNDINFSFAIIGYRYENMT